MIRGSTTSVGRSVLALGVSLVVASPALAQQLGQGAHYDPPWWRVIGALLFCVLLAVGAAFVLRGRLNGPLAALLAPKGATRRLRVIESTRLSPQVDVCLLQVDEEELLLAISPQGAAVLRSKSVPVTDGEGRQ
jgi:flagellar biogenesis protein FliO